MFTAMKTSDLKWAFSEDVDDKGHFIEETGG
jgi:hypothetical protein